MAYSLDSHTKRYVDRLSALLATKPDVFRTLAMRWADSDYTNFRQPWQLREFIAANYDVNGFDVEGHLPDSADSSYLNFVFTAGYELLHDKRASVCDPSLSWIKLPFISSAEVAKRMSMSESSFLKKLSKEYSHSFSEEDMLKLAQIRQQFIDELRPQVANFDNDSLS